MTLMAPLDPAVTTIVVLRVETNFPPFSTFKVAPSVPSIKVPPFSVTTVPVPVTVIVRPPSNNEVLNAPAPEPFDVS